MDEFANLASSKGGIFGIIATGMVAGGMFLRKYWLGDRVDSATSSGHVDVLQGMKDLLDKESNRADLAEARAEELREKFYTALDQITTLKGEIQTLTGQVADLNRQLANAHAVVQKGTTNANDDLSA